MVHLGPLDTVLTVVTSTGTVRPPVGRMTTSTIDTETLSSVVY